MLTSVLGTAGIASVPLQSDGAGAAGLGIFFLVILLFSLAVAVVQIAGMWKVFEKADQPGWGAIIPIYNVYLLLQIVGRPAWWLVLFLVPFVNFIIQLIVSIDVAKSFGEGTGYGIGIFLLPIIFYPLLGFGDSEYQGPAAA